MRTLERRQIHEIFENALEESTQLERRHARHARRARTARHRLLAGAVYSSMPLARAARAAGVSRPTAYEWFGQRADRTVVDEYDVLVVLAGRGRLQLDQLAGNLRADKDVVADVVEDLASNGLIRSAGSVGYHVGNGYIAITDAGERRLLELIHELAIAADTPLTVLNASHE